MFYLSIGLTHIIFTLYRIPVSMCVKGIFISNCHMFDTHLKNLVSPFFKNEIYYLEKQFINENEMLHVC